VVDGPAASGPALAALTRREHEIATDVAEGLANKHIARRRGISVNTVENHLRSIFRKTGVNNRTKLALATGSPNSVVEDWARFRRPRRTAVAASLPEPDEPHTVLHRVTGGEP
jgi:DNA-binding CsgD family transcriptional regulator